MTTNNKNNSLPETMFNLTILIKQNYEQGKPIPKELLSNINFSEISQKDVTVYDIEGERFNFVLKESILSNIISHLPLNYYKDYTRFEWIYAGEAFDHSIIHRAIGSKNFAFIHNILLIGETLLLDMSQTNKIDDYDRYVLKSILDLGRHVTYLGNSNNIASEGITFKNVYDLAINQFQKIYDKKSERYGYNSKFHPKKWFKEYDKITSYFGNYESKLNTSQAVLKNIGAISFLEEMIKQEDIKNPICTDTNFRTAFFSCNLNATILLNKKLNYEPFYLENLFIDLFQQYKEKISNNLSFNSNSLDNSAYFDNLISLIEYYTTQEQRRKIKSSYISPFFINNNNKKSHDIFVQLFPQLLEDELVNDLNLKELITAYNIFSHFIKINSYEVNSNQQPSSYQFSFIKSLHNAFPNIELDSGFINNKISSFIKTHFLPLVSIKDQKKGSENIKNIIVAYDVFLLENNLEPKKTTIKKLKI